LLFFRISGGIDALLGIFLRKQKIISIHLPVPQTHGRDTCNSFM
jgi:hypothetical protein